MNRHRLRTRQRRWPHYVYELWSADGECLYVGCSLDPRTRTQAHRYGAEPWRSLIDRVVVSPPYPDRVAAHKAEQARIRELQPRGNYVHTDRYVNWRHRRADAE